MPFLKTSLPKRCEKDRTVWKIGDIEMLRIDGRAGICMNQEGSGNNIGNICCNLTAVLYMIKEREC